MGRLLPCMLLALLATACSSVQAYDGPERDDEQLAYVLPENQRNRQRDAGVFGAPRDAPGRTVVRIDGKTLGLMKDRFAVLPGRVDVQAIYSQEQTPWRDKVLFTRATTLSFTAVAGHTYAVRGRASFTRDSAAVTLFVVDGATGRSVASVAVPERSVVLKTEYQPQHVGD